MKRLNKFYIKQHPSKKFLRIAVLLLFPSAIIYMLLYIPDLKGRW